MKKINFLFGIHCHQPVGNFESVFEDAYNKSYLPFIEILEKFPKIKMTVHYTGVLLTWFKEKHPEFLEKLKKLAASGQIEIMSGGYYEPIISILPDSDKIGQIKKQNEFTKNILKFEPRGMWLAERVWEPHLPNVIAQSGIEYTVLDDYHFISAGLPEESLKGYFITEEQGFKTKVFPISKTLRYLMPFRLPHETIEYLQSIAAEDGNRAAIIADDGEKFGVWPGTHKWVFEEKWLENFFNMISDNSEWIITKTFSEYMDSVDANGRIYLPAASYFEMMEWSLLTSAGKKFEDITAEIKNSGKFEQYRQFIKGGFWRNFLAKYPESNSMHKKMLHVSKKISQIKNKGDFPLDEIKNELWMGQCNCPYWHGVFGGLYLNYLRHAIYEHLIKAENMADKIIHSDYPWIDISVRDFDADGHDEILVDTKLLNVYFAPHLGGSIFEIDFRPKAFNIINTMSRQEEVYHKNIVDPKSHQVLTTGATNGTPSIHEMVKVKEEGLQKLLNYDWYRKTCFIDHFLGADTTIGKFSSCRYEEEGDFVLGCYEFKEKMGKNNVEILLERTGSIFKGGIPHKIRLRKTFLINSKDSEIDAYYEIENLSDKNLSLWIGTEFNISLLAGNAPDRYYIINGSKPQDPSMSSIGVSPNIYELSVIDKWSGMSIIIEASKIRDLWRFPIETVSQSEGGFERTYQQSCILLHRKINLTADNREAFTIRFRIKEGDLS